MYSNNLSTTVYDEDEDQCGKPSSAPGSGKHSQKEMIEYERYLRREIPPRVRRELEVQLEGELNCVGETMKHKGVEIFQSLSLTLFRDWANCASGDSEASSSGARGRSASPPAPAASDTEPPTPEAGLTTTAAVQADPPEFAASEHQSLPYSEDPASLAFLEPEDYILDVLDGPGEELLETLLQPHEDYADDTWHDPYPVPGYGLDVAFAI